MITNLRTSPDIDLREFPEDVRKFVILGDFNMQDPLFFWYMGEPLLMDRNVLGISNTQNLAIIFNKPCIDLKYLPEKFATSSYGRWVYEYSIFTNGECNIHWRYLDYKDFPHAMRTYLLLIGIPEVTD